MKTYLLLLSLLLAPVVLAQTGPTKIFARPYATLGLPVHTTSSGVYGVAAFDVAGDSVWFKGYDDHAIHLFSGGASKEITTDRSMSPDLAVVNGESSPPPDNLASDAYFARLIHVYSGSAPGTFAGTEGTYRGPQNQGIDVRVEGRNSLEVHLQLRDHEQTVHLGYPGTLAYAECLGVDIHDNLFVLAEEYLVEIPLAIRRTVICLSDAGAVRCTLLLPEQAYCTTVRDLQIDREGNLYHLITDPTGVSLYLWSGMGARTDNQQLVYPQGLIPEFVPPDLPEDANPEVQHRTTGITAASRTTALRLAETYVDHHYACTPSNLVPGGVTGPDGDVVETPSWLINGMNGKIAYMWGGFSTVAQYDAGLAAGKYAGDINTAGVSRYAVGVDCSGFVSRCWQLSSHYSTSMMPGITGQYSSWDSLRPGDAALKSGHVRLFTGRGQDGSIKVVEASGRDWGVSYWRYAPSALSAYTPRYYTGMVTDYSTRVPEMLAVLAEGDSVNLRWRCDTVGVRGYRLYTSPDGHSWSLMPNEQPATSCRLPRAAGQTYYRVASVLNTPAASESQWSGALGVGAKYGSGRYLVVDGSGEEENVWFGGLHQFASRYGTALAARGSGFETVAADMIDQQLVDLSAYDGVLWIAGERGIVHPSFSPAEQQTVRAYLLNCGRLFVTGSEIGSDLWQYGTTDDKAFFQDCLRTQYLNGYAAPVSVAGMTGSCLSVCALPIGQVYDATSSDVIGAGDGAKLAMVYNNGQGAGVQYAGQFGGSGPGGAVIYLAFAMETTADDSAFCRVIWRSMDFFENPLTGVAPGSPAAPAEFRLEQNYPNPFNPKTAVSYQLSAVSKTKIAVYDMLGREIAVLVNETKGAGSYTVDWNAAGYASGTYICRMVAGDFVAARKLVLMK
jgi:hypothetical protein